jgi:peptide alpha-N-acetyltransferase
MISSANASYYWEILEIKGIKKPVNESEVLSADDQTKALEILDFYIEKLPKAGMHKRLVLLLAQGERFQKELHSYCLPMIKKGVPSMLRDFKNLYSTPSKVDAIFQMLSGFIAQMDKDMTLQAGDEEEQDPTIYLWLNYYMANHYLFVSDFTKAFEYIDKCIEHTPTVVELYTMKAKIFKHAGDHEKAFFFYNEGRALDTADRYLNARCARYQIKLDQIEEVEKLIFPFSKDGTELNIHDMQQLWYECQVGESYLRQ